MNLHLLIKAARRGPHLHVLRVIKVCNDPDLVALAEICPILADTDIRDVRARRHDHCVLDGSIFGLCVSSTSVRIHVLRAAGDFAINKEINIGASIVLMTYFKLVKLGFQTERSYQWHPTNTYLPLR
jgi:hypothetical protein